MPLLIAAVLLYLIAIIPFQLTCMYIVGTLIGRLIIQHAEKEDITNSIGLIFIMALISVYSGGILFKPYVTLYVADLACMYLGILNPVGKRYWKKNLPFLFNPFKMAVITSEMNIATDTSNQEIKANLVTNKNLLLGAAISTVVYFLISFALTFTLIRKDILMLAI